MARRSESVVSIASRALLNAKNLARFSSVRSSSRGSNLVTFANRLMSAQIISSDVEDDVGMFSVDSARERRL